MKIEKIKEIPKYIVDKIRKLDLIKYPTQNGNTRFYSYLTKNDGELVKITVAVRNKYKKWYYKQCAIHGVNSNMCYIKDMAFSFIAGYRVGWFAEGLTKHPKWYEDDDWGWSDDKFFRVYSTCINPEYALKLSEYKYSACDKTVQEIISYLRLYKQYPQVEYLVKAGLHSISTSKPILRRIANDKKFCKWLISNKEKIQSSYYYKDVVLRAYTSGRDLDDMQNEKKFKLALVHDYNYKYLLQNYDTITVNKIVKYVEKQDISLATYRDYLDACNYLELDMTEDKNLIPHDFKRWHDIRIDEYNSKKAILDEQKRQEFYEKFYNVAMKYIGLEYNKKAAYIAIIAQKPSDLIIEGNVLCHCVGRMNYDQRFVREDSLIFFIRTKDNPTKPFVTVEYSPSQKKILQCYGYNDSTPSVEVLDFVNKKWLPYANRQISKMVA